MAAVRTATGRRVCSGRARHTGAGTRSTHSGADHEAEDEAAEHVAEVVHAQVDAAEAQHGGQDDERRDGRAGTALPRREHVPTTAMLACDDGNDLLSGSGICARLGGVGDRRPGAPDEALDDEAGRSPPA